MLRITKAWTNRDRAQANVATWGYVITLNCVEPRGGVWRVNAHIGGRGIGLTDVTIQQMSGANELEELLASDEDDNDPESWTAIEASEARAVIDAEMDRARATVWAREYVDHFALVSAEYEMLLRALSGPAPVQKYLRFTDPIP